MEPLNRAAVELVARMKFLELAIERTRAAVARQEAALAEVEALLALVPVEAMPAPEPVPSQAPLPAKWRRRNRQERTP